MNLAIALVHYPVYNRKGEVGCTNVTNFDLHDLARLARTYGLQQYFVIHPYQSQRAMVARIHQYWTEGLGSRLNPDRKEAMDLLLVCASLAEAVRHLTDCYVRVPWLVYTDARALFPALTFPRMRRLLKTRKAPCLLVFGTGWGIQREEIERGHYFLQPIATSSNYNHLSVRSAASIILDRLLGER
jgi:hypothetical protein